MILRVFPGDLAYFWPQIEALIAEPISHVGTHTAEDVRLKVLSGAAQAWIQWAEPIVEAVLITEFVVYPRGPWVRIWLDGASGRQEHEEFLHELEKWREANGCVGFECIGRPGWTKLFPDARIE